MKIFRIFASFIILLAACSHPVDERVEDIIDVSIPASHTKVHLEGLKTCWNKGDELTVFYKTDIAEKWIFKGETGDVAGQIGHDAVSRVEQRNDIFVVYPYDSDATLEGNVIHTSIPSEQTFCKGSYGTAMLAAWTDFDILTLRYCTAIIELRYSGPAEVSKIELRGNDSEKLSGTSSISFNEEKPRLTCNGVSSVTLNCNVSVQDAATESFYFSIAPGVFSKGVTFIVHKKNGETQKIQVTEPVEIAPGHIYTVVGNSNEISYNQKVLHLLFSDGSKMNNPFTKAISFKCGKEIGPYYLKVDDEEYPFYMYCQVAIASGTTPMSNFRITNGGGLYIGGTAGDYIKFPAIPEYKLQEIAVSIHKGNSDFQIVPTASPEENVKGGKCIAAESGDFRLLSLSDTKENTSYSMKMMNNVGCFRFITLYYRK